MERRGLVLVVFDWSQCWFMPCQRPVWQPLLVQQRAVGWNSKTPLGAWICWSWAPGESTVDWRVCFRFSGQDKTRKPVFQLSCWTGAVQEKLLPFVCWNRCVCYSQLRSAFQGFKGKMFCMWVECNTKIDLNSHLQVSRNWVTVRLNLFMEIKSPLRLQQSYLQLDLCHMVWSHTLVGKRIFIFAALSHIAKINFASVPCPAWTRSGRT